MALIALLAFMPLVYIIGLVTGKTDFIQFDFFLHRLSVARETHQLFMRTL